jgi:hypothetical protein
MNTHKFYPVQEPQPEEFDEAFLDTATNLINRMSAIMQPGILPAVAMYKATGDARFDTLGEFNMGTVTGATPGTDAAFTLNIGSGIAFARTAINDPTQLPCDFTNPTDLKLERIFISPSVLLPYNAANPAHTDVLGNAQPKSTGSTGIILNPLPPGGARYTAVKYHIYVAHLPVVDTATDNPANPGNKYTINPKSGQINYTHWIDGYQIKVMREVSPGVEPSVDLNDERLGVITCTNLSITNIDLSVRRYACIPSAVVMGELKTALQPAVYGYNNDPDLSNVVNISDHINAVGDIALVGKHNPHGTRLVDITGTTGQSPYLTFPADFHHKGIVDKSNLWRGATPGPFFATSGAYNGRLVANMSLMTSGQMLYLYGQSYSDVSHFWSEVRNESGSALEMRELLSGGTPILRVEFPTGLRSAGCYYIYAEDATPLVGLALKAKWIGFDNLALFNSMVISPDTYLTPTQYPIAVCKFTGSAFIDVVDPQTGYSATGYNMVDMRQYGTMGPEQLSTTKRFYAAGATMAQLNLARVNSNMSVAGDIGIATAGYTGGNKFKLGVDPLTDVFGIMRTVPGVTGPALSINRSTGAVGINTDAPYYNTTLDLNGIFKFTAMRQQSLASGTYGAPQVGHIVLGSLIIQWGRFNGSFGAHPNYIAFSRLPLEVYTVICQAVGSSANALISITDGGRLGFYVYRKNPAGVDITPDFYWMMIGKIDPTQPPDYYA